MKGYLVVRARVEEPGDREAFDRWYAEEHLPEAKAGFEAQSAWRGWSDTDPAVHLAFYEFETLEAARAILDSVFIRSMIAEFDRRWGARVTRSREIVGRAQSI